MAKAVAAHGVSDDDLIAGFYNIKARSEEVYRRLGKELEYFDTLDFRQPIQPPSKTESFVKNLSLEEIESRITKVQQDIKRFMGEHFTREYRTIQGHCDKLLQQLDNVDHKNNPEVVARVESALKLVKQINGELRFKVMRMHPSGACCKNCELFDTKWQ